MPQPAIRVRGATQNNLKNIDIDLPLGELIVITGVSGSGKSSLAFDTVYAEGQRRYVETFSPYARQFLDRMDKPAVDRIDGIPPSIAIDQTNPVRTSRSTVGTMTELSDHLKLLYARVSKLYCQSCDQPVGRDNVEQIWHDMIAKESDQRLGIAFDIQRPRNFTTEELRGFLAAQGYLRVYAEEKESLTIIQDRLRAQGDRKTRFIESLEAALRQGQGRVSIINLDTDKHYRYSTHLHCARCDLDYADPTPSMFSFNSPLGACETCRGFGRTMGIDYNLVVPNESLSISEGAVKPWQTKSYAKCQRDLVKFAKQRGVSLDTPWAKLSQQDRDWVIAGEGSRRSKKWYGIRGFFVWLETKSYKMHVRVMLARFRSYDLCEDCQGTRLKPIARQWRLGNDADGPDIHRLSCWPIDEARQFFDDISLPAPLDDAADLLLNEIRSRLRFLCEVGLAYLTLDRQSRTLSGGEVQRINLTTALGTSLVNTLFVLDEPSIGLHSRDIDQVVTVMQRLRDAGNSLIVVEHDPQIIAAADRVIDMGPGPGERGGEVCFTGTLAELRRSKTSLTAPYITGKKRVTSDREKRKVSARSPAVRLKGANEHNLCSVNFNLPLNRFVVVTGVSGSGKSTLIENVLFPAVSKALGKPKSIAGEHRSLSIPDSISEVVMVDQSAIGKTTRSNPASFVGAFDAIRKRFVAEPLAVERGYTPGTFSFNSGNGRCAECGGNGFEHIEMQFLSDVYLRCTACNGKRYRDEILEVTVHPAIGDGASCSIAEVLDMTVAQALAFFGNARDISNALRPLIAVGLDYLKLGQPVPTLSGGEAQRLKLAKYLAEASKQRKTTGNKLFLFDEPTTGLHFQDIAVLLKAFGELLEAGHSLAIIEHNLDVVDAADWVVDLGPEGGRGGGQIVFAGVPDDLVNEASASGKALATYRKGLRAQAPTKPKRRSAPANAISIHQARENNLKNVDLAIPRDRFCVISGVSGSGKSTLAFDIVFNEGQRRYLESLNAYARQFVQPAARPDVDAVYGIPPTVAIEQRTSRGGHRSTVGTMTEVHHFLRLLFVKLGVQHCPDCDREIRPQTEDQIVALLFSKYKNQRIQLAAPLVTGRKGYYTDLAKWAAKKGYASLRVDGEELPTDNWPRLSRYKEHHIELPLPALVLKPTNEQTLRAALAVALDFGKGQVMVIDADGESVLFSTKRACTSCHTSFDEPDPRLYSYNSAYGWCTSCQGKGVITEDEEQENAAIQSVCDECDGQRLNPIARAVRFKNHSIVRYSAMPVSEARTAFDQLPLNDREQQIARDLLSELRARLAFLEEVGLGYLSLDRPAPTLSGGEAQRIRLAAQLGSQLRGVCYVLDEPTIGLHARDNQRLLATLKRLQQQGNSVIVVEHDEDTIRAADYLIDVGPGAGVRGGEIVAAGTFSKVLKSRHSLTAKMLREPLKHPLREQRRAVSPRRADTRALKVTKASLNNLRNFNVAVPLDGLVGISGVSGSGKSTLVRGIISENLRRWIASGKPTLSEPNGCESIDGYQSIDRVLEVDQTPIGKTPRSCPATYVGFWNDIRELFAGTPEARMRGYTASRFSFNVKEGRCPECEGQGMRRIEMSFLPDVRVACDSCHGMRFTPETLSVRYREQSIGDVLKMDMVEALAFFDAHPKIKRPLSLLNDVGLGYLTLGQQSPTLSGGEAQRIKLVSELAKARQVHRGEEARRNPRAKRTLYVLDEPTIGLHMADVEKLIHVLHRLVDAGHSVLVIEHNLDVLAETDWLIDLGPEGGRAGGAVVYQGAPEGMASKNKRSITASSIRHMLDV